MYEGVDSERENGVAMDRIRSLFGSPDLEVVQLKFLQKSNAEQMGKLRRLWNEEPLVLHYYLSKFVFPEHMRTQRLKLSASGQSVGGDMLVGRRVGFSGTPSDLLPKEMGDCDYETGDDGKMLTTVLDLNVMSFEALPDGWSVSQLLSRIATAGEEDAAPTAEGNGSEGEEGSGVSSGDVNSSSRHISRFNALIDTGALITGYSNRQVAAELLKRGLSWCDGVVFLDSADKQQVSQSINLSCFDKMRDGEDWWKNSKFGVSQ